MDGLKRQVAGQNITQKSPVEKMKVNLQYFWGQVVPVFEGLAELGFSSHDF